MSAMAAATTLGVSTPPVLWQFALSHYVEKVRWALDLKQVPHVRRSLLPGLHINRIKKMTGQTAVPVFEFNGAAIHDSSAILREVEKSWPEPPLYPSDPVERERAVELEDYLDERLGVYIRQWCYFLLLPYSSTVATLFVGHSDIFHRLLFRAIFPRVRPRMIRYMNIYPAEAEAARQGTIAAMDRIARELQPSGYLVGDCFTVADLTAAALLWPLVMPKEFPYKLPTKLPAPFAKEREQLAGHGAITWAADIYRNHRGRSAAVSDETVI
jgi:glutathione S-transferase